MRLKAVLAAIAFGSSAADAASPRVLDEVTTGQGMVPKEFQGLDADGDGYLSGAEVQARSEIDFGAADQDGDGRLSRQEVAQFFAQPIPAKPALRQLIHDAAGQRPSIEVDPNSPASAGDGVPVP
jgi:hypothetical protein